MAALFSDLGQFFDHISHDELLKELKERGASNKSLYILGVCSMGEGD